jgi:TolA-binding protein
MTDTADYQAQMEKQLNDMNRKIAELKTKVNLLEEHESRDFYEHLKEFTAQQEELKSKLQKMDTLESEAQAEMKRYLEETFQNLSKNLEIRLAPQIEDK